jgi:hypothetical protein
MFDPGTWIIIALFYAPLHFLVPILVVSFRAPDAEHRRKAIIAAAVDCAVSMTIAFALAIWLAADHLQWAVAILLLFMLLPYLRALRPMPASADRDEVD